eukprot:jgi/Ulvmu1/3713/UM170_0019.1
MRTAMAESVASGFAGLNSQLEDIHQQIKEAALHMQEVLAEVKGFKEVWDAIAFGDMARVQPGNRSMLSRFAEAADREERCIFDQNLMACPATRVRFTLAEDSLDTVPTLVPGCHCTVVRAVAERYREDEHCGVCQQHVPRNGELKDDRVALYFLEDLKNGSLPAIRKFDVEHDFTEDQDRSARQGTEGVVRFGMLRGEPVAVKTVQFAMAGTQVQQQRQWRCRRHVLLNSVCTQHRAARASPNVCDLLALCWGETCAHIAMPQCQYSLEKLIATNAPRGMRLHHVLSLCCSLTRAVHDVHALGILHCDINPSNVLLADDGSPRLIDFGLSHVHRDGFRTRTSIGHTLQYASPEQVEGRVNAALDIHALGRTLAYAATGSRPSRSGQKLPKEPPEVKEQLQAMTGTEKARKAVRLLQVIAVFEGLLKQHGPMPVTEVRTTDALTRQLAFGDIVDMGGREITIADGETSERPVKHVIPEKTVFDERLHIETWQCRSAPGLPCWDLVQTGATLRAVTLTLPEGGQLHVLNDAAAGTWQSVTVKGEADSTVMITGQMVLERVTFERCTLVATENADLTLSSCTFSNCQVAAMATGAGASIKFHSCEVHDCGHGIVATDGATVAVDSKCCITCSGNGFGCCIIAQGAGSSATVTGAALHCWIGRKVQATALWGACAAALQGGKLKLGGDARLAGMAGSNGVLSVGHGSMAELDTCAVEVFDKGAWASCRGTVHARRCTITGGDIGLLSEQEGSFIHASDCTVSRCWKHCISVDVAGRLELSQCNVWGSQEGNGVMVASGSTAVVTEGSISSNAVAGVCVTHASTVTVRDCTMEGNAVCGPLARSGGNADLHDCKLLSSAGVTGCGVAVSGTESRVTAEDCRFEGNASHGARVHDGGLLRAVRCSGSKNGPRAEYSRSCSEYVRTRALVQVTFNDVDTTLPIERVTADRSKVVVSDGQGLAGARYTGPVWTECSHDHDQSACGFFACGSGSRIMLENKCTATENLGGGFVAADKAHIVVYGSHASENVGPGAAVMTAAIGEFVRCGFRSAKAAAGVEVVHAGTAVSMSMCTALENIGSGVCLRHGAKLEGTRLSALSNAHSGFCLLGVGTYAKLHDLKANGNACGVVVLQRAVLKAEQCSIEVNISTGLHVEASGAAELQGSMLKRMGGSGVCVTGRMSTVTLKACEVANNQRHGLLVKRSAVLDVLGKGTQRGYDESVVVENRLSNVCVMTRADVLCQDCKLMDSIQGHGLAISGWGTCGALQRCVVSGNKKVGIKVEEGAQLVDLKNAETFDAESTDAESTNAESTDAVLDSDSST